MDKVTEYRKKLIQILERYTALDTGNKEKHPGAVDPHLLFDRERDHYQVLGLGWVSLKKAFGTCQRGCSE
jgi:XisI protein